MAKRLKKKTKATEKVGRSRRARRSDVKPQTAQVISDDAEEDDELIDSEMTEIATQEEPSSSKELSHLNTALAPTDPLRLYLREISVYPLLDPQEEFDLASRLAEKGDINAAKRLVQANLRLVVKIAFEYQNLYTNIMDLIQEGNIGLMKAVSKFDPTKGARLGYYASWWIRSYILKYLLDNFRLVKVGTTQAQKKLFYHLMREKQRLEAQGILAGPKLLAQKLDVKEKEVVEMQQRLSSSGSEMSLDAPVPTDDRGLTSFADLLADESSGQDVQMIHAELLEKLRASLPGFEKTLNEKEKQVLQDRVLSETPKTLQEVADEYGLTRERVRQIESKLIEKLREYLKPVFGSE